MYDTSIARRQDRRPPAGFTLIELLVVVAILGILVAILAPSFARMRDHVLRLKCQTNLHAQGVGLLAYVAEYHHYPAHVDRAAGTGPTAVWPSRIRKYVGSREAFWCPAAPEGWKWQRIIGPPGGRYATAELVERWGYELGERMLNVHEVAFSYGYNDWGRYNLSNPQLGLGGDLWNPNSLELPAGKVVNPRDMLAIMDSTNDGSWDFNCDPTNPREYPGLLHFDGSCVLFADGNVGWYTQADLVDVDTGTDKGRRMSCTWNNTNRWER